MSGIRSFLGLLIAIIIVGILLGGYRSSKAERSQPALAGLGVAKPTKVNAHRHRIWRQTPTKVLWRIGENADGMIYHPSDLEIDSRDHVFVVDRGDYSVKEFSPGGRFIRRYGRGEGQGPGEFSAITNVVFHKEELWVSDGNNSAISVFDREGELMRTIRTTRRPYRVVPEDSGGFVVMRPFNSDFLLERFAPDGTRSGRFGSLLEDQLRSGLALDGWIEPDGGEGLVYAGHYVGWLGSFTLDGRRRYLVETIEPRPLPRVMSNSNGRIWVDREARASSFGLSIVGQEVHLHTHIRKGFEKLDAIDTYDLATGAYLYSRLLPTSCSILKMTRRHVYLVDDTGIAKWRVEDAGHDA